MKEGPAIAAELERLGFDSEVSGKSASDRTSPYL